MKSVDTVTSVLDLLSSFDGGLSITEISKRMNLPLGTAHRFLKSLLENGLITQDPQTKLYKLGLKILSLASSMLNSNRLIEVAREPMRLAAEQLNQVVYLSQENGGEVYCVYRINPTEAIKSVFVAQIGNIMPFHAAAAAKVIYAYYPQNKIKSLISRRSPLPRYTSNTKITEEEILKDSSEISLKGYAVCDEELEAGVIAIAAPVFDYDGEVIASVAVTGIKANVSTPDLIKTILDCGKQISTLMGYSGK